MLKIHKYPRLDISAFTKVCFILILNTYKAWGGHMRTCGPQSKQTFGCLK